MSAVEHSSDITALAAALSSAQAEFVAIPKDSTNPFYRSKYASLPKVIEVAAPILTKHGLAVSQFPGLEDGQDTLTTWLMHKSGQFIRQSMRLHLTKADAQGQGSAMTYARRYSYMAALGLVADEDDDGNGASGGTTTTRNGDTRVSAAPASSTERTATAKQRGLIFGKAGEKGLPPISLAGLVLDASESAPIEFESQSAAEDWLRRALDRLPARHVNPILERIENATAEA